MNYKKIIYLYVPMMLFLNSCKPSDAIIDTHTGERIVGWKNAKYIIGDSIKITMEEHKELYNNGIYIFKQGILSDVILRRVEAFPKRYSTNIGITIGDSLSIVESKYGKPLKRSGHLMGGGTPLAEIFGLEYKRWGFIADRSVTKVEFIILYDKKVGKKIKDKAEKQGRMNKPNVHN